MRKPPLIDEFVWVAPGDVGRNRDGATAAYRGAVTSTTTSDVRELFDAAVAVQANAHAPYSRFRVGAAIRGGTGRVYAGCNVENAAYPQGSCAEAGAISAMVAAGERVITAVLTVCDGDEIGTCCGGCRQRIREFAAPQTPIYAAGPAGVLAEYTLEQLLPVSFGPGHLTLHIGGDV